MRPEPEPLLIRGARLLDSTAPVDVHLAGGRIAAVGDLPAPPTVEIIDAEGGLRRPPSSNPISTWTRRSHTRTCPRAIMTIHWTPRLSAPVTSKPATPPRG
ncbi:hypothetical protein ACFQY7_16780 [Actinomadura luteofluorescens]|uniref:hypothetical protein n=1 Tax=Actinomadura luteofluorescens TaxID=46163 RepID=UPI003631CBA3